MNDFLNRLPVNWALLAHPANWVIILLMVMLSGLMLHLVLPSTATNTEA